MEVQSLYSMSVWTLSRKWQCRSFDVPSFALEVVANMPRVVGGLPVSIRAALLVAEVMCFGLRKRRHPNVQWILRGLKARLVSDGKAVSQGRMSGMLCR